MKAILFFFTLVFALAGCGDLSDDGGKEARNAAEVFTAAEWNVQALFDGKEDGGEYDDYREAAGWKAEKYEARLNAISEAITRMIAPHEGDSGDVPLFTGGKSSTEVPGVVGLVEIENPGVLKDLASGPLAKYGYNWTAFAAMPGAAFGLGALSRFPITETKAHSISDGKESAPRPVLELRVEPRGKPLVFLICHWKSKLGNASVSEALRRASGRVVQRRLRELKEAEEDTPVIVMGDLNETYEELASASSKNALVLSAEKPPRPLFFEADVPAFYSPWTREMKGGSYYYRGEWESIDHFLLSARLFDGAGWDFADCVLLKRAPFTAEDGSPDAYFPRNGTGLSDHLPLLLYLRDTGN